MTLTGYHHDTACVSWGSSEELGQLRRGVDTPGVAPQGEAPPGEALPWFGLGFKVGIRA